MLKRRLIAVLSALMLTSLALSAMGGGVAFAGDEHCQVKITPGCLK